MRITGGQLKGRIIKCPEGTIIRPAMDKMRESVFAILGDLDGASWLDLFSGSGSVALEAVSRGAKTVEACEKDRLKAKTLLQNVSLCETEMGVKIKCHFMAVELFVKRSRASFDYVFLDPPFAYKFHEKLVAEISQKGILNAGGTLMIHRPQEVKMPETAGSLLLKDRRFYGRSVVDFYS